MSERLFDNLSPRRRRLLPGGAASTRCGLATALVLAVLLPGTWASASADGDYKSYLATCGHLGVPCDYEARKPKLKISVHPRLAQAGSATTFRLRVTRRVRGTRQPVPHAVVSFAGRRTRTDRNGRAVIHTSIDRAGVRAAVARKSSRRGSRVVRILK